MVCKGVKFYETHEPKGLIREIGKGLEYQAEGENTFSTAAQCTAETTERQDF